MITIQERAEKYADGHAPCYERCGRWTSCKDKCYEWNSLHFRYSTIATEQKAIDDEEYRVKQEELIDKACEWLKRELADPMPDELYQQWCNEKLNEFRKELEQYTWIQ